MRSRSSVICAAVVAAAVLPAPLLGQGVPPSRIVPLGISPGPALEAMRQGLAPCAHAEQIGCRENFSPAAFRIEATMPAGMLTWFPGGAIPLAIESETAPGDPAPQTPEPLPRAHLRRFDEQGHPDPRAVSVPLTSELPPEVLAKNRHQIGANELVSPWIIALADPRASIDYDWPAGLSKEALGCAWCERPLRLQGKEGVHEILPLGAYLRVRVDLTEEELQALPAAARAWVERLAYRLEVVPADLTRPAPDLVASANPPTDGFRMEQVAMLHTREIAFSATDLGFRARNTGFAVTRVYSSAIAHFGPFGRGFDSPLFARIRERPDGSAELYDGTGRRDRFTPVEGSLDYAAPTGVFLDLRRRPAGGWALLGRMNARVLFDRDGRLEAILDANALAADGSDGNVIRFLYDSAGRLATVVDPIGRPLEIRWHTALGGGQYPGLIASIRDFAGREVRYSYDLRGRLVLVEGPDPESAASAAPRTTWEWDDDAGGSLGTSLFVSGRIRLEKDALDRVVWQAGYDDARPWAASAIESGGGTWQLASNGAITTVVDPIGVTRAFHHDSAGRVVKIADASGAESDLVYDASGRLVESREPLGDRIVYAYDDSAPAHRHRANIVSATRHPRPGSAEELEGIVQTTEWAWQNGLLLSTTSSDGATQTIARDARGNPVSIVDPSGVATANVFDDRGLLLSTSDPRSGTTTFTYESADPLRLGNLSSVATLAGTTEVETDGRGNVVAVTDPSGRSASFSFNALDQLEVESRAGSEGRMRYDATGAIVERRTLEGHDQVGEPLWQTASWEIDALGRVVSSSDEGVVTSWTYDAAGNTTHVEQPGVPATVYTYDALGRIASLAIGERVTTYGYDANGRSAFVTDALGRTTEFVQDGFGASVGTVDAIGIRTIDRHDDAGRPVDSRVVKTLADGTRLLLRWTVREFDDLGRLVAETRKLFDAPLVLPADGSEPAGASDVVSRTIYDDAGRAVVRIDPRGGETRAEMDELGRVVRVIDPMGNRLELAYDASGNRISETLYEAGAEPEVRAPSRLVYDYDGQNRLIAARDVTDPERPLTTLWQYDPRGNVVRVVDTEVRESAFEYDARGRRTKSIDAMGAETRFVWDGADRLVSLVDANGNETKWIWDPAGRLAAEVRADGATWSYAYDVQGNRKAMIDPNGTVTTYHRDALDRVVALTMERAEGVRGPSSITFVLDDLGRAIATETDEGVKTAAGWDSLDRQPFEAIGIGDGALRRVDRGFDAGGLPVRLRYPSGMELERTFDGLGRLSGIAVAEDAVVAYRDEGLRQVERETGNSVVDVWSWDASSRISGIESRAPCGIASGCDPLRSIEYVRRPAGVKAEVVRPDLALLKRYELDRLDRIVSESREVWPGGGFAERVRFELDAMLNLRNVERIAAGTVDATGPDLRIASAVNDRNQITSFGVERPAWDANGNLVGREGVELSYDASNRLARAALADGTTIGLLRDAFGRKVRETLSFGGSARVTEYAYDGERIAEEYVGGGASLPLAARYIHGRGIDEIVRAELSTGLDGTLDAVVWPLQDELGTVDALIDGAGAVVARFDYGP